MNNKDSELLVVTDNQKGMRLDQLLQGHFNHYSRTYFQKLINSGKVLVNGEPAKKRTLLELDDEVEIAFTLVEDTSLVPEKIPLEILFEDEAIIVLNKPAPMVVHPGAANTSHTLVNALLYHLKELPGSESLRPGIVHRLDKETTGVIVVAKTEGAQANLIAQFAARTVQKEYLAICIGKPQQSLIRARIGRNPKRRQMMSVVKEGGKPAETSLEILEYTPHLSYVRLFPKTGRTHQIRVHLKSINHPVLGDSVYGKASINEKYRAARQMLHAHTLTLCHPSNNEIMQFCAPIAEDMKKCLHANNLISL